MSEMMNKILAAAAEAGAATAKGSDGMMHLGKIVYQGALAKQITDGKGGNVGLVYKSYLKAATQSDYGSKVDLANDKALKFGVSKLAAFVKFAKLKGNKDKKWDLVRQTVRVVNEDAAAKAGGEKRVVSRYEQILRMIRVAVKDGKATYTDKGIREALAPKAAEGDAILRVLETMLAKAIATREASCVGADIVKGGYFSAVEATLEAEIAAYKTAFAVDTADLDLGADEDEDDAADHDEVEGEGDEDVATLAEQILEAA